jgi:hypothetical protein
LLSYMQVASDALPHRSIRLQLQAEATTDPPLRSPSLPPPAPFNWADAPHTDLPLIDTGTQEEDWELPIGDANDAFINNHEFQKVFEINFTYSDFSEDSDDEDFYDGYVLGGYGLPSRASRPNRSQK